MDKETECKIVNYIDNNYNNRTDFSACKYIHLSFSEHNEDVVLFDNVTFGQIKLYYYYSQKIGHMVHIAKKNLLYKEQENKIDLANTVFVVDKRLQFMFKPALKKMIDPNEMPFDELNKPESNIFLFCSMLKPLLLICNDSKITNIGILDKMAIAKNEKLLKNFYDENSDNKKKDILIHVRYMQYLDVIFDMVGDKNVILFASDYESELSKKIKNTYGDKCPVIDNPELFLSLCQSSYIKLLISPFSGLQEQCNYFSHTCSRMLIHFETDNESHQHWFDYIRNNQKKVGFTFSPSFHYLFPYNNAHLACFEYTDRESIRDYLTHSRRYEA